MQIVSAQTEGNEVISDDWKSGIEGLSNADKSGLP
jgi:hypothetical protein